MKVFDQNIQVNFYWFVESIFICSQIFRYSHFLNYYSSPKSQQNFVKLRMTLCYLSLWIFIKLGVNIILDLNHFHNLTLICFLPDLIHSSCWNQLLCLAMIIDNLGLKLLCIICMTYLIKFIINLCYFYSISPLIYSHRLMTERVVFHS